MKFIPKITRRRLVVILIVVIAIGGYWWWRGHQKKNGFEKATVERGEVIEALVLSGDISATEHAELGYETSGKLVYVGVKEGDRVKRGALLGKLDTTALNSAYQQALANLRKYDATVENVHDQVKDHSGDETFAQKDLRTTAEATKDSAYEAVIIAERNLKGASLYSPFDGIVTYVASPFSGVFVVYSQKQFEVVNPDTIYFDVSADQTDVTEIYEGQEVEITLDSYQDSKIHGTVESISFAPGAGEAGVVYKVKVVFNEGITEYRLGMTGDAEFVQERKDDILWVPPKFINSDETGKYVLTSEGKKKVYVEVGLEGEERVEIRGDITEGETVYD